MTTKMIPILLLLATTCVGCGGDPATAHDTLTAECIETNLIVLDCVDYGVDHSQDDLSKCGETADEALAIPGCQEIEEEAMSCTQDYFLHAVGPMACPGSLEQLSADWQLHCADVISRGNALHCPDFL